uniref:trp operon leader peptide n=1 Tax=Pseudomonas tritici TaxID=2745518 RepID=A0A8H9YQT0_9PSED
MKAHFSQHGWWRTS